MKAAANLSWTNSLPGVISRKTKDGVTFRTSTRGKGRRFSCKR